MEIGERTVLARITGRVEGVSFRVWSRDQALSLDLGGWVRNEADGSVSLRVTGPGEAVGRMIERPRHGPPAASVQNVEITEIESAGARANFQIVGLMRSCPKRAAHLVHWFGPALAQRIGPVPSDDSQPMCALPPNAPLPMHDGFMVQCSSPRKRRRRW